MEMDISQWMKMVQIDTADGVGKAEGCIAVQDVAVFSARYVSVKYIL
jgi:hypothetical protein